MASKKISFVNKNPRISFNKPTVSQNKEPEDTGERFVNSSKIIGSNHEFVNYTEVADSYNIVELETNSSQKYDNSISGFTKNRTFEVTLENVKKLSENQAAELPNQLKAVIAGETDSTKTNYRTEFTDLLANPKTKNYYEINNFSVQQLIYIDRFEKDNNDNIILNKPVYKLMNFENFRNVNKPVFCFFQNYTNNSFGITDENRVSVMDSSFILSDRDITTKINQQVSSDIPIYSRKDIGYQFMNSNIVKQTNQPVNVEIQQLDTTRATSLELEMRLPVSNNISTLGTY